MKNFKYKLLTLGVSLSLSACSLLQESSPEKVSSHYSNESSNLNKEIAINEHYASHDGTPQLLNKPSVLDENGATSIFITKYRHLLQENQIRKEQLIAIKQEQAAIKKNKVEHENQDINFYVRRLMQDLVNNLNGVDSSTPVAVTDFVILDSDLNTTNLLGHQIAESLTHEIHKFGIPVIDFKATGYIRVTEEGDFFLTRNYEEISSGLPIRFIFTGVLTKHQRGHLVSAKVVDVQTKTLVGSAQSFIPEHVSNALISSKPTEIQQTKNEVLLIKG